VSSEEEEEEHTTTTTTRWVAIWDQFLIWKTRWSGRLRIHTIA